MADNTSVFALDEADSQKRQPSRSQNNTSESDRNFRNSVKTERADKNRPFQLVQNMVNSGKNVAKLGLIGLFPACYLGIVTMTTAGTILAAGFAGGMAIYFAINLLKNLLSCFMQMDAMQSSLFVQLQDMGSLMLAGAAGALLLGSAIYPVVACVALGILTLGLVKLGLDPTQTINNIGSFDDNHLSLDKALEAELSAESSSLPCMPMGL